MGFWNWIFGIDNSNSTSPSASTGSAQNNNGRANMKNNTQASRKRSTRTAPATAKGCWFNGIGKGNPKPQDTLTVYAKNGKPLTLHSSDIQACGGEGTVYTVPIPGKAHALIKIYKEDFQKNSSKTAELNARIEAMTKIQDFYNTEQMGPFFAWPRMTVWDKQKKMIGFAMHRCTGSSFLPLLGGPASVKKAFPGWDRRNLLLTAIDFVKKVEFLAAHGVLINDFNPANFLVDKDSNVSFIDCDSYQIPDKTNGTHITHTFFPSHVAPELLRDKQSLMHPRNIHHVEFGTALVVFQLLMCGLHPYNYYDPSHQSACGTPDENLLKGRCPLGIGAGCRLPQGGWYKLWSYMTGSLKGAFIATFRDGHSDPEKRTSLEDLRKELEKFLYTMDKDPIRRDLTPATAKPRGDKTGSGSAVFGKKSENNWSFQ